MKTTITCIGLLVLFAAMPAQSDAFHLFHHPIFHHHGSHHRVGAAPMIAAPLFGNLLANPPSLLQGGANSSAPIMVDSAVQSSIAASKQNLDSAASIINDLLKKNGVAGAASAPASSTPTVSGIPEPAKKGPIR